MQDYPSLHYPFEERSNPNEARLEAVVAEWIDNYKFLDSEKKAYYKRCSFGMITSCFYPNAPWETLLIGARLVVLLFIHDDITDELSVAALRPYLFKSESIMAGHDVSHDPAGIYQEFLLFRNSMQNLVTVEWLQRWNNGLSYFYDGIITERYFMDKKACPTIDHYLFIREHLIGMYIFQDLVELYLPELLPYQIISHPHTRQIRQVAARIIAWCNDYFSAAKELESGQLMNLVIVILRERNCSLEEAYFIAEQIHAADVSKFLALEETAPDFGHYNDSYKIYINELKLMFKGNYRWHASSARYQPS
ncbi:hypothetical protein [Chitinophaga sp. Cy-1792]|uniref:terpene synthase family protein n=1 Tax=Chitinophaga sp. Cy-1792 TaxID=2608339 RepID=UPI0014247E66|nr:hypothetical protein [Chitinophaga sp. Cy-1792]NIG54397.1 hypothetical protein [Chitinophaga sp. Cy-1792]